MRKLIVVASAAAVLVVPAVAVGEEGSVGQHVSQCAQIALPPADARAIVCEHDGHVHAFTTFGDMVRHLLEHRG